MSAPLWERIGRGIWRSTKPVDPEAAKELMRQRLASRDCDHDWREALLPGDPERWGGPYANDVPEISGRRCTQCPAEEWNW